MSDCDASAISKLKTYLSSLNVFLLYCIIVSMNKNKSVL